MKNSFLHHILRCFLLTILLAGGCLRVAGQELIIGQRGGSALNLVPGVTYQIYDPGGHDLSPQRCDYVLLMAAPAGCHIYVTGVTQMAPTTDSLIFSDSDQDGIGSVYRGNRVVQEVCTSGYCTMHYKTDSYARQPGFILQVTARCTSGQEIDLRWSKVTDTSATLLLTDNSAATHWTVQYGTNPDLLTQTLSSNSPRIELEGLQPSTTYFYRLLNNAGQTSSACSHVRKLRTAVAHDAPTIVHNVSMGPTVIHANESHLRHVITGSTTDTNNRVLIERGFKGTVTLRDVDINFHAHRSLINRLQVNSQHSPIRIEGENLSSNLNPVTEVDLILEGQNHLSPMPLAVDSVPVGRDPNTDIIQWAIATFPSSAAIQVDVGATVRISAINPSLNSSGTLCITEPSCAGIGASSHPWNQVNITRTVAVGLTGENREVNSIGGNIVIHSGIIQSPGYGGCGIGGSATNFWDGAILMTGGIVKVHTYEDRALGQCYVTSERPNERLPNSVMAFLPPTQLDALGGLRASYIHRNLDQGGGYVIYEPNSPGHLELKPRPEALCSVDSAGLITIRTADNLAGATIYMDVSNHSVLGPLCDRLADHSRFDPTCICLGQTNANGLLQLRLTTTGTVTFYTDAANAQGRHYASVTINPQGTITLPQLTTAITTTPHAAPLLHRGYTPQQARDSAFVLRITYNDPTPLLAFSVSLAKELDSPFDSLLFLSADSATVIHSPATLTNGTTLYIVAPLKQRLPLGGYEDFLKIEGQRNGLFVSLCQKIKQFVVEEIYYRVCEPRTTFTLGNGTVVSEPGLYIDTLSTRSILNQSDSLYYLCDGTQYDLLAPEMFTGHDSVTVLRLDFLPTPHDTTTYVGCDSLWWRGQRYTTSGFYQTTSPSATTCDSIHSLQLDLKYSIYRTHWPVYACDSFLYMDYLYRAPLDTIFEWHYSTEGRRCDSISSVEMHISPNYNIMLDTVVSCASYTWYGQTVSEEGFHLLSRHRNTMAGCDSLINLPVVILDAYQIDTTFHGCDRYVWRDGQEYTTNADFVEQYHTAASNCDSTVTVHLRIHPSSYTHQFAYLCHDDEPVEYLDQQYWETGEHTFDLVSQWGCDSTVTLHIELGELPLPSIRISPNVATPDNLEITLTDTYGAAVERLWLFDEEPFYSSEQTIHYPFPYGADSVQVRLIDRNSQGCVDSTSAVIPFGQGVLWVPNAFTPRLSTNNTWGIVSNCLAFAEVTVYSRQGQLVAHFDGLTERWDGTYRGQLLPQGVYTYHIRYATLSHPRNIKSATGTITLLQ